MHKQAFHRLYAQYPNHVHHKQQQALIRVLRVKAHDATKENCKQKQHLVIAQSIHVQRAIFLGQHCHNGRRLALRATSQPVGSQLQTARLVGIVWSSIVKVSTAQNVFRLLCCLLVVLLSKIAAIYKPLLLKQAVNQLSTASTATASGPHPAIQPIILMGVASCCERLLRKTRSPIMLPATSAIARELTLTTYFSLLHQPSSFYADKRAGSIASQMLKGHDAIMEIMKTCLFKLAPIFIEMLGMLFILGNATHWGVVVLIIIMYSIQIRWTAFATKGSWYRAKQQSKASNQSSGEIIDTLNGIEVVQLYNTHSVEQYRYHNKLLLQQKNEYHQVLGDVRLSIGQVVIQTVGTTLALTVVLLNGCTAGDIALVLHAINTVGSPLMMVGKLYSDLRYALVDAHNLLTMYQTRIGNAQPSPAALNPDLSSQADTIAPVHTTSLAAGQGEGSRRGLRDTAGLDSRLHLYQYFKDQNWFMSAKGVKRGGAGGGGGLHNVNSVNNMNSVNSVSGQCGEASARALMYSQAIQQSYYKVEAASHVADHGYLSGGKNGQRYPARPVEPRAMCTADCTGPVTRGEQQQTPPYMELDDVCFTYPGGTQPSLSNVTLRVHQGQCVALVGPSGGGKSSIVKCMLGVCVPSHGQVNLLGVPLQQYTKDDMFQIMSCVQQDVRLFNATVLYNILYGALDHDGQMFAYSSVLPTDTLQQLNSSDLVSKGLRAAAQQGSSAGLAGAQEQQVLRGVTRGAVVADIHDDIQNFEEGYYTWVGPRAARLSGGQKQRIAIARAAIRLPSLLVLDEATCAMQAGRERLIYQRLQEFLKDSSMVIVSHRLPSIRWCDVIYVIDSGRILQQGTHTQLVQTEGWYQSTWMKQQSSKPK